jgi:NADH-quinone oxidoreductase subunit H
MTWNELWPTMVAITIILLIVPVAGLYMTFIERRVAALVQDRLGPNRVGPAGLLQAVADGLKIMLKEQIIPRHAHRTLYFLAPTISLMTAMFALAVVPFGPVEPQASDGLRFMVAPGIDVGLVLIFAVSSLSAYGVILGGWSSNNKYSLYGGIRSCAQFLSYEIPLALSVLGVIAVTGSMNLERIVAAQGDSIAHWNVFWQPLAAVLFFASALAETNRLPFDLPECEQELVGGFHTEYSGIKFVLFFLAEYTHVLTVSLLTVLLFFGGWHFPGITGTGWAATALGLVTLMVKVLCVLMFIMMLRWTLPRFRFDQLMALAWKGLIPLGVINVTAVLVVLAMDWPLWWMAVVSVALMAAAAYANVLQLRGQITPQRFAQPWPSRMRS